MIIYTVIGGWNYEGEVVDSIQLFYSLKSAEQYATELTTPTAGEERSRYDYAEIRELTVTP
jgi:hypothetical protein